MIKLWKKEDLNLLSEYPKEVVENVDNTQEWSESAWLDFKISFERRYDLC